MSSGKLDQSLDEIMKDRKTTDGPRRGKGRLPTRKIGNKVKAGTAAPTNGIAKFKPTKSAPQAKTNRPGATLTGSSKIAVSNLPEDVNEVLIKDFFGTTVAPVKHVILNYGPTGRSRGSATVIFYTPEAALEATKIDGTKVDRKPIKIERVMTNANVPAPAVPKPLAERMSKPKNAATEKPKLAGGNTKDANKGGKGGRNVNNTNNKKSGRAGRPKPKTTDELNAEMDDYWGDKDATTNSTAQPAPATTDGDVGMVDEIM